MAMASLLYNYPDDADGTVGTYGTVVPRLGAVGAEPVSRKSPDVSMGDHPRHGLQAHQQAYESLGYFYVLVLY